ncbi:MAG: hypothetical protein J2P26_04635 [Nocardiopsaceae bacterium]|nr:hypothetical protein [Nocardiopsaceae bacterium]
MLQDLGTLAPSAIVGVAFLVGVAALVRRELAPKRKGRAQARPDQEEDPSSERRQPTEL